MRYLLSVLVLTQRTGTASAYSAPDPVVLTLCMALPGHLRLLQFVIFVFVLAHLLACILYGIVEWEYTYPINWATEVTIVVPGPTPSRTNHPVLSV